MDFILLYLLLINALGCLVMIVDKSRARKKMRRISEVNLFTVAAAGGALGELAMMYLVRHKTRHRKFTIGLPLLLSVHILLLVWFKLFHN